MRSIEITVRPDGSSALETKGFSGSECQDASRFLEVALGLRSSEQLTAEYHSSQSAGQQLTDRA